MKKISFLKDNKFPSIPIWYMRQSGRYLPNYQKLRQSYSFEDLCKNPELAAKTTLIVLDYLPVDMLILFSDILFILELIQAKVVFTDKGGPQVDFSFDKEKNIPLQVFQKDLKERLREKFFFVKKAIQYIKKEKPDYPLIGFSGGPMTLMAYLLSDHFKYQFKKLRIFLYQNPEDAERILSKIALVIQEYIKLQIEAGIDMFQIFETWGFQFASAQKINYTFRYLNRIMDPIQKEFPEIPFFIFGKNYSFYGDDFQYLNFDGFSFDWTVRLEDMRKKLGDKKWIQGNFDPYLLYADKAIIKEHLIKLLEPMKKDPYYIFNLGHGVLPDTPFSHLQYLSDLVHELGRKK